MSELLFKTAKENAEEMFEQGLITKNQIKQVEERFLHYMEGFRMQLLKDNIPPLSPETIEVIRVALHELKCLNVEELLGITKIDYLKKQTIKQAQAEFNKVYGELE